MSIPDADLKGLELLYEYTKFHIGLYLTLATAYLTAANLKLGEASFLLNIRHPVLVYLAILCFLIAGLAGGVIVSSITQCFGLVGGKAPVPCPSTEVFLSNQHGPYNWQWFSGRVWTWIEHTSFWIGLLVAVGSFAPRRSAS